MTGKEVMKTRKTSTKRATIIAMAAITGATIAQECAAARAALSDMKDEMGRDNVYSINYTWDPFDGFCA